MTPVRAWALGALTVGVLDGLDAIVFVWLRSGVGPGRVFQVIAGGLLGRAEALEGGSATILLGVLLHFTIAAGLVGVYLLAARFWPVLVRQWVACGLTYGLMAYAVMHYVVIPLSALPGGGPKPAAALVNGILIHLVGVGLPAAWFARRAVWTPHAVPTAA